MANNNTLNEFEKWFKDMPAAELGELLKEYVRENNHSGWDAWDRHYMTGVRALFLDMMLYHTGGKRDG